jgi:hypothetical protein
LQTKFSYQAQEIRNFWLQELYIPRLALGKVLAAAAKTLTPLHQANCLGTSPTAQLLQLKNLREVVCIGTRTVNNSQSRVAIFFFDTQWVIQKTTRAVRAAACPLASQFLLERTEEVRCVPQVKEKFGRQQLRAGDGLWW